LLFYSGKGGGRKPLRSFFSMQREEKGKEGDLVRHRGRNLFPHLPDSGRESLFNTTRGGGGGNGLGIHWRESALSDLGKERRQTSYGGGGGVGGGVAKKKKKAFFYSLGLRGSGKESQSSLPLFFFPGGGGKEEDS